jgi:aminoglycoside phosphotransferase (APT) family kinase protein
MADHELAQPDRRLLGVVARLAGVDRVWVTDETLQGESRSTFVAAGGEEFVVKLVPAAGQAIDNQLRLVRMVRDQRQRGFPAPEYVGVGESSGTIFTLQRRLPGQPLHRGAGAQPAPGLFAAVLPSLLAAVELQRNAGDLARPPWPAWLLDTIEAGGNRYCLHATMRQAPRTAALFGRLQSLARRNQWDEARTRDVVHFDMNPANILHAGGRLSGVVDWNIPFDSAGRATAASMSRPCCFIPTTLYLRHRADPGSAVGTRPRAQRPRGDHGVPVPPQSAAGGMVATARARQC